MAERSPSPIRPAGDEIAPPAPPASIRVGAASACRPGGRGPDRRVRMVAHPGGRARHVCVRDRAGDRRVVLSARRRQGLAGVDRGREPRTDRLHRAGHVVRRVRGLERAPPSPWAPRGR